MKHLYPLPALLLSTLIGSAQAPVLDMTTNGTLPGDAFTYQSGPWLDPGAAGADVTWDLTVLSTDSVLDILFIDPATTPEAASYPSATIAAVLDASSYSYSEFNSAGGWFHGLALDGFAPMVYSDPMQMVVFPATMGTTWTDPFHAEFDFSGIPVVRDGSITALCDAYGTLQLPWGTLTDVLRATYTEDYTDDYGFYTSTVHREYTQYMQAGTRYPIVYIFSVTTTTLGNTFTITGSQWMDGLPTGVNALPANTELSAAFDPMTGDIVVQLDPQQGEATSLELVNAAGAVVAQRDLGVRRAGGGTERLHTRGLARGAYMVRLIRGDRATARKVMVE